jgi:tRNA uridine 5-carbamoylmethylation protein Kti12
MSDCKKIGFENEKSAKFTLKKILEVSKKKILPKRAYMCSRCGKWHLTSKRDIKVLEKENLELRSLVCEYKTRVQDYSQKLSLVKRERNSLIKEIKDLKSLFSYP